MLCGAPLEYLTTGKTVECSCCGKDFVTHVVCPNRHYICDICHNNYAVGLIKQVCSSTDSTDPIGIFEEMLRFSGVPMLGCHHAFMAAGAFIAAIKNEGTLNVTDSTMEEVFLRTGRQAVGGYCGLTGVCGITPALGACFAVILGSKCGTDREQRLTMDAVCEISAAIRDLTGPSCCKAYARKALETAQHVLKCVLGITLSAADTPIACHDAPRHPHGCRKGCPYLI
ncbi:MAG: DUF5714 domain-containing protein [Dissulfurimicrobium sp.]|uniref:DUF5714 domain-containing protein n=1 Tax=Dissulfurimicrobium TaxID=1769732 RepID=UPI003C70A4BE